MNKVITKRANTLYWNVLASISAPLLMVLSGCSSSTGSAALGKATITWATPAAITYGTALSATQLDATASIPGTLDYAPAAGAIPHAGTQTLSVSFIPATGNTTTISSVSSVSLVVNKANPVVSWPTPPGLTAGALLGAAQLDATSNVAGTFVYTPAAGAVFSAGTQTLSVTFTPADSTDYNPVTTTTTLTVGNPSYTWNNVRIVAGGFITGIVQHPTTQNLRYVRTDIGGAYRWDPVNNIWVPLLDFLTSAQDNYLGVESIALDPTNPQKLYMAVGTYANETFSGPGAFMVSSNQGASFTIVPVKFDMGSNDSGRFAGERLAVDPNLPSTLYFGSRLNGLWRSTDSGFTWSQVTSFPLTSYPALPSGTFPGGGTSGVGIVFVDFVAGSGTTGTATPVIYAGVSDSGAAPTNYASLYRSTDGGTTWAAVPNAPTGLFVNHGVLGPDTGNNTALYLSYADAPGPTGILNGALWKYTLPASTSPAGAGTWTNISVATPSTARPSGSHGGYATIALDPERPGVVMATTIDDYNFGDDIYRSINYGSSWVSFNAQKATRSYASVSPWLDFHVPGATLGTGNWPGSLIIDAFNSNHMIYGNGQTLWDSINVETSDTGGAPAFNVGALGIEETSVGPLISPTAGATLLSGVGDIDGFVHTDVTQSPSLGQIGPNGTTGTIGHTQSLDFAQNVPLTVVLCGTNGGAYATDGGLTATSWHSFTLPAGSSVGQGTVSVSADGTTIVWATADAPVAYSTNYGLSWTASAGAIQSSQVFSDRINAKKFYILSGTTLQISTDGGHTFTNVTTNLPSGASMSVSPAAEGDLWIAAGATFQHSTNSGATFGNVTGLSSVNVVGFGMPAQGLTYPTLYTIATGPSGTGFYRSIDEGQTWYYLNDAAHQFAYVETIIGDPRLFGRVYFGTNGRGIFYGDSPF